MVADFGGGANTCDAGVLLLSEADKRLRLTQRIAPQLDDLRCKGNAIIAAKICFDRMLICQALIHGLVLLTPDEMIRQYPVRTVW